MPDNNLSILLTLDDRASEGLKKVARNVEDLSRTFKNVGRDISQVGNTMTFFSGGVLAPFILALKNTSKTSLEVSEQFKRLDSVAQAFQRQIATAVLPVVERFTNILIELWNRFQQIPEATRNAISQMIFMGAIFTLLGGLTTSLIGKIVQLVANVMSLGASFIGLVAANPILAGVLILVGALLVLMLKFKPIADTITSTFEVLWLTLKNGFLAVKAANELFISGVLEGIAQVLAAWSNIPGAAGEALANASNAVRTLSGDFQILAQRDMAGVVENARKIGEVLKTGQGDWSHGFEGIKDEVLKLIKSIEGIGTTAQKAVGVAKISFKDMTAGAQTALQALSSSLSQAAAANKSFAEAARVVSIALAIVTTAAGISRALQDYPWPYSMVVGAIVAAAGAIQIATIASQKFHSGGMVGGLQSDERPIIAQTGEGVLSRRGMANLGGAGALNALNSGGGSGGNSITIIIQSAIMDSSRGIAQTAEDLGFAVERNLRTARGI